MCSVVSVTMKSEYELVSDAVLGTDLHLSEEYSATYTRWLSVGVDMVAATIMVPPSVLEVSCTVFVTMLPVVIIVIRSTELVSIVLLEPITTYSSKPSNSQWVFFTGTSYTELIVKLQHL